jgi:hypothetical protein
LSISNTQGWTVDTILDAAYRLDAGNQNVCRYVNLQDADPYGFSNWLGSELAGLSRVSLEPPRGTLNKLTYDATFAVTNAGSIGATLQVILLNGNISANRSRTDTQHLHIEISGTPPDTPGGTKTGGGSGDLGPLFRKRPDLPAFSGGAPRGLGPLSTSPPVR